jgi:hypothetical protein
MLSQPAALDRPATQGASDLDELIASGEGEKLYAKIQEEPGPTRPELSVPDYPPKEPDAVAERNEEQICVGEHCVRYVSGAASHSALSRFYSHSSLSSLLLHHSDHSLHSRRSLVLLYFSRQTRSLPSCCITLITLFTLVALLYCCTSHAKRALFPLVASL